jgi:hypothetical protein
MTSSAAQLNPPEDLIGFGVAEAEKQYPLHSLVASARRLTAKEIKRKGSGAKAAEWQEDAWDMFDLVGEQRFLATTLANRLGQARFFVGKMPENSTEDITPETSGAAHDIFMSMAGKREHFKQMVTRLGMNLFMPGDGYLVGLPPKGGQEVDASEPTPEQGIGPLGADPIGEIDIDTLEWRMLSVSECSIDGNSGDVTISGYGEGKTKYSADDIVLIRVWRSHPKVWWDADSPTRSSLPVLRELVGLTMHISAQVDSRLAGAGLLLVPTSAEAAMRAAAGANSDLDEGSLSPFAEALMDAMIAPINDRSNASAVVPLTVSVPDESIDKFRHMSFAGPLDAEARELRDEAIRRLALGQDCPPELLLGVGGMNHWGAWLVREDVVTTHLEPPLALICDAITTQFLWPVLEQQGVEDFEQYAVWYDVDHLVQRPGKAEDAKWAKENGLISDESSRDALGFDESDAPKVDANDPVKELVLEMLRTAPSLAQNPGLPVLAQQIRDMLDGKDTPLPGQPGDATAQPTGTEDEPSTEGGVPATANDTPEDLTASAAALDAMLEGTEDD